MLLLIAATAGTFFNYYVFRGAFQGDDGQTTAKIDNLLHGLVAANGLIMIVYSSIVFSVPFFLVSTVMLP